MSHAAKCGHHKCGHHGSPIRALPSCPLSYPLKLSLPLLSVLRKPRAPFQSWGHPRQGDKSLQRQTGPPLPKCTLQAAGSHLRTLLPPWFPSHLQHQMSQHFRGLGHTKPPFPHALSHKSWSQWLRLTSDFVQKAGNIVKPEHGVAGPRRCLRVMQLQQLGQVLDYLHIFIHETKIQL